MTKQELIERVAARRGLAAQVNRKTLGLVVDAVFAELAEYFVEARASRKATPRFSYPGFGTFTKKSKKSRAGRHPQTGEPITIPPSTTVAFAPGQELRAALNGQRRRRGT